MSTLSVQKVDGVIEFAGDLTVTGNLIVSSNTVSVNGQNVSPVQSFRNKIINGNFDFWQRETSNTSVVSGQYVADRWRTGLTGTAGNISRQSFTLGQTDVPNEPTYFHRIITTSSVGSGNYYQSLHLIESVRTLAGQTATLSFWAKADASKNIAVEFTQYFGTGGSPSSQVNTFGSTCALTTSWQKFTVTVSIPSISGKTIGSNNDDYLRITFWLDAGSNFNSRTNSLGQQSGTFDIAQVQLEAGSVATPFEVRPMQVELALCQRYYHLWNLTAGYSRLSLCYCDTTTSAHSILYLPVSMRVTPTISSANLTLNSTAVTSITFSAHSQNLLNIIFNVASGLTADTMRQVYNVSTPGTFTASAEL